MKKNKVYLKNNKSNDSITSYYDLKQESVNDLVNALNETVKDEPVVKNKKEKPQFDPYKIDKLSQIPTWIKVVFIKFWTAGAICFFFLWGLGLYIENMENLIVITAIATGLINDFLVTPAFLYFESDKKEYRKYLMVPVSSKKIWSVPVNILIAFIEVYGVVTIYAIINRTFINTNNLSENHITLGVEPLLYGLFYLIIDLVLLFIKNTIVSWVSAIKRVKYHKIKN